MDYFPPGIVLGESLLPLQDISKIRRFLIPDSILKAKVVGLAGDKAVLSISGERILAEAGKVPLVAGQVLEAQVKQEGNIVQLKILNITLPEELAGQSLPDLLQAAGLPDTTQTRQLALDLASLKIPLSPETLREASQLLPEKPTQADLKAYALLKLAGLPAKAETFALLQSFFDSQETREIPGHQLLHENFPSPSLPGEPESTLVTTLKQALEVFSLPAEPGSASTRLLETLQTAGRQLLESTEARLLALGDSAQKLEKIIQDLEAPGAAKGATQKAIEEASLLLEKFEKELPPEHPLHESLQKARALLSREQPTSREQPASREIRPDTPRGKEDTLIRQLKEAVAEVRERQAEVRQDPLFKLQTSAGPREGLPPALQAGIRQVAQFLEGHRAGNLLLSRQDLPLVSIPIPLSLNGREWVGYLHIYGDADEKNFQKKLQEGNFTLKFAVSTRNLGPVDVNLRVHEHVLDGTFQVKGGEEKKFIEHNSDKLLKRLEHLPFKVRSIEARIGGMAKAETGWNPTRFSGMLDIRV